MVETRSGNKTEKRTRPQKEKDPNAPKRPSNAYFLYCADHRDAMMKKHPELKIGQISKKLGVEWKELDSQTKKVYQNKFENAKKEYDTVMEKYSNENQESEEDEKIQKKSKKSK
jgi:hypothetical protein